MDLRKYQSDAVSALFDWFGSGKEKPIVVLPTGTGKSLVQAEFVKSVLLDAPYVRIVCATHSQELVDQNYKEMMALFPACPAGVYSAGLKRRESSAQVLFAGVQSIYNKAATIGWVDIIIVDEAHSMSGKEESRWDRLFSDAKKINPNVQIIGLSATPYRMDTGNLVPRIFDGIAYEYPITQAIKDGYLCEVISAHVETHLKASGVSLSGGEFVQGELERAVDKDELTIAAMNEVIAHGKDRESWLIFAAGNTHARHINDYLLSQGIDSHLITQDTPKEKRKQLIQDHRNGKIKCIVNNMILTTGYNNPRLDLIACLRPTQSAGLWVQMVGRGMRLFQGKANCLLLDFGRNLDRHGPIDKIRGHDKTSSGNGEAPMKQCPECKAAVHAAVMECPDCGYEFVVDRMPDITHRASDSAVFSTQKIMKETPVLLMHFRPHRKPGSEYDVLKVTYVTQLGNIHEFVCLDHPPGTYPHRQAVRWHQGMMGKDMPSVSSANVKMYQKPSHILVVKEGKYYQVKGKHFKNTQ